MTVATLATPAKTPKPAVTAQPLELLNEPAALLHPRLVQQITSLGKSAIQARVSAGTFPKPVRLSSRCVRFKAGEVKAWLSAQQAA